MTISATSGIVSNIDYQSLITQLVNVKKLPIDALNSEKSSLEKANSAYGTLSSRMQDLRSAAEALRATSGFNVFTASSSDDTMLGASASSTASAGSYSIIINALAKAHKIAADGVASDTSIIASAPGSFVFQVSGGAAQTVSVDGTTTLTGLRDSINNLNSGVSATIVNDGSATNPYRLILTSSTTGASNGITITQNDTTLLFSTTLQAAQDASFSVDGLNYARSSNNFSDVVTGVTIDLKGSDALKTTTLTVKRDTADIEKKVTAFVDKYNSVVNYIKTNNRYDRDTKTGGAFFGDSVARSIWDDLRRTMTSAVSGLPDTMNMLIHVGITSNTDGQLVVDGSKLSSALSSSFNDVVNLFTDKTLTGGSTKGLGGLIYDAAGYMNDVVDGRITARQKGLGKNITRITEDIRRKEDQLAAYENLLRAQFASLETILAGVRRHGNYLNNIGGA